MFKKIFSLAIFLLIFSLPLYVKAQDKVEMYFIYSTTCPHCTKEKAFLDRIEPNYPNLIINKLEVGQEPNIFSLLSGFEDRFDITITGVPFTVVGEQYFTGYYTDATTGAEIERAIKDLVKTVIPAKPIVEDPVDEPISDPQDNPVIVEDPQNNIIQVPFIGELNTKNSSLFVITAIFGFLDGFNPCAMWALLFLISLLLGMKNRKRMWFLGSTFIIVSALVYFFFMVAWLKLILFLGFITLVRVIISLVALAGGGWNLKSYFQNKDGGCEVTGVEKRKRIFDKLKNITQQKSLLFSFLGIIILAFSVNLVELICSAGLPAVYTQILALNNLPSWQYYAYISCYILVFMLDDLLVFIVAMWTLKMTGVTTKYAKYSKLIGGILMIIIGLILLLKPELLMLS